MSESVTERDAHRIESAIAELRRGGTDHAKLYNYSRTRVDVNLNAREAYSYGRHFPLFRYLPRNGRHPELFIINGDEFRGNGGGWHSSRTPGHQAATRRLIADTGVASLIIPFSALTGANINIDSIRPVHTRPDKTWQETRYAETLNEVPRWERTHSRHETLHAETLADVPEHKRARWSNGVWAEIQPDSDGLYSWSEYVTHNKTPDPDGRYSWTVHMHRLGDCLFSAERNGRRARYLSSFDMQETPSMYFLAQLPRGAGDTVDMALEALAPRAVHAARARGLNVHRQGDIFLIETQLTDIDLYARGVTARARLTQWDRDAKPRKGEVGYTHEAPQARRLRLKRFHTLRRAEYKRQQAEMYADTLERQHTAVPWRANKRRQLVEIQSRIDQHKNRILVGDRWDGFHGYTVTNAETGLARETRQLAETLNESRAHRRDRLAMSARRLHTYNTADGGYLTDGNRARVTWQRANEHALAVYGAPLLRNAGTRLEQVRATLAIYGTAHTAREVLKTKGGAVYVRGRVVHRPGLVDIRRDGRAEHAPLQLRNDRWYLAVRNTVPRARR